MGGVNGINYFEPKHFLENYKIELSFYERINLQNNKDYYYLFKSDTLIELEYEENNIRLYYSSLLGKGGIDIFRNENLIKPNDGQFSNQLDLYGLKPGRNSIIFFKSSFIGIQNSLGIVFKVNYPFYLQWYFLVLILVVIFLVLFIIFRFREKLLKARYLESLEGNREQMFQMIAHDLKSPMNMYTNLLNTIEFLISKKRFEDIKVISRELIISSRSIDLILNNLLNLGRGKDLISERKDPISLLELANRLNEIYGTLAKVKNIHFNIECFRDITLYVNEGALQICLQNLVDNAVKYAATEVNVRLNYHLVKQMFVVQVNNDIHPENREHINALLAQLKGKKEVLPGEFGKSLGLVIISRTANRLGAYIRPRLGKRNRLELRLSFKVIAK